MTTTTDKNTARRRDLLIREVRSASASIRHAAEQLGPCPGGVQLTEDQAEEATVCLLQAAVAAVSTIVDSGLVGEDTLDELEGALTAALADNPRLR